LKRYSESSAAIYAVLAVGPGWDWKTLSGLYSEVSTYEAQLRALEDYCQVHTDAADALFLLGYHYLTTGATDEALAQFRRVTQLEPKDTVSASLVRSLSPRDTQTPPPPSPAAGAPAAIPAADLVGTWTASGKGNATFTLLLDAEGKFTWGYSRGTRTEEVKGVYVVEGNVLALEPDTGGTLLAELAVKAPGKMHFQMIGAEENDPGLDFQRGE
jgi:tetratricopeptide (TPR) repeat protein